MSDLIGKSLGRYHILEQIGEGGMATVYKAQDTRLDAEVAVKVIRTEKLAQEILQRSLTRFEREAKTLARLNHPNIIRVTDYGEHEGKPYLVMPYFPSGSLKQWLGKPIPWQEAFQLILPIARALDYAHRQNMIHRDVKPSNILMTADGEPMLTDFGIAKVLDLEETADLTGTGMGIGTPEYMAPEQWQGNTSTQSDVYSLGVVLYEMITGRKPYTANTPAALLLKQATEPLPRPTLFVPDLPDSVEQILIKALTKNSHERFETTSQFALALEKLQKPLQKGNQAISGEEVGTREKNTRRNHEDIKINKKVLSFLGIGALLIITAIMFASGQRGSGPFGFLATATPTKTPTPTLTPTPVINLGGEWELVIEVTDIIEGADNSEDETCPWVNELVTYFHISEQDSSDISGYYQLEKLDGLRDPVQFPFSGSMRGTNFTIQSEPAAVGSCKGSVTLYEGYLEDDELFGNKTLLIPDSGKCCIYVGKFTGHRVP
jgi:serine/threonine protein kinase